MGGIWLTRLELITTTSEVVGYKSGLALSRTELTKLMPPGVQDLWSGSDEAILRVRSEELEQIVVHALHAVGNIPTASIAPLGIEVVRKYRNTRSFPIVEDLLKELPSFIRAGLDRAKREGTKSLDPTPFLEAAWGKHGPIGAQIGIEIMESLSLTLHRSPWGGIRRVEWSDVVELKELFKNESLETLYGTFFDQRFIDYLSQNFDDIDRMNWRKFEGLTCEFFDREGFHVEIGEGRNDDNVDARVWPKQDDSSKPPAILVQCKRQQQKVGKVVVKALWADVQHESAASGLIVTTSALSPGARKTATARGYEIDAAERTTLRAWIQRMRTPFTGVVFGE